MDTEVLKTFVVLARNKSFSRTAETLYVAQSTVTNRIAELEKELGKRIFFRDKKNVMITEEGLRFLDYAERILELEEMGKQAVHDNLDYEKRISIGTPNTVYDCGLNERIREYMVDNPNTAVKVKIDHSANAISYVSDGTLDCAFSCIKASRSDLVCIPYKEEEMILVTNAENREYADGIRKQELPNINFYYCNYIFQGIGEYIRELFPKQHLFQLEISRAANIIPYIQERNVYSIFPRSMIKKEIESEKMIEIPLLDLELPSMQTFFVYKEHARKNREQVIAEVIDYFIKKR